MARAAAAGFRVVLVVATRGERGEPTPGVLADDEPHLQSGLALRPHQVDALAGMMAAVIGDFERSEQEEPEQSDDSAPRLADDRHP